MRYIVGIVAAVRLQNMSVCRCIGVEEGRRSEEAERRSSGSVEQEARGREGAAVDPVSPGEGRG